MDSITTPSSNEHKLQTAVLWIRTHQERFWTITGTLAAVVIAIVFAFQHKKTQNEQAWTLLGNAQTFLAQGRLDEAKKALNDWTPTYQNSSAKDYALFLKGDLLYKTSDYAGAAQIYGDLSAHAHPEPLRPLALSAQAAAEEMAGHFSEARTLTDQFLQLYPDHFLAATSYLNQARYAESAGSLDQALKIYNHFILLYPETPWTPLVKSRIEALSIPSPK